AIRASEHPIEPASLRFVTPDYITDSPVDDKPAESPSSPEPVQADGDESHTQSEPESVPTTGAESDPEPAADPNPTPGVTVVITNEGFEHRAQAAFDDESPIHRSVIMGDDGDRAASPSPSDQSPRPAHFAGPHDDQPLAAAMLAGRPIMDAALERINTRLGRDDICFVQGEDPRAAHGVPVTVADQVAGTLVCDDPAWIRGGGRAVLGHQARWLSTWIRLEKQQAELRRCAFTDTLTGAWNRRYFTRFLDAAIEQSRAARQPLSVMLFDIDEFKHYNDAYGHAAGDDILVETVRLLKSVIRPSDRVCRVGGDEFVVIFYEPAGPRGPDSKPLESVYQIACRFQKQICQHRFPKLGTEALGTLTVSGGLASFPWDGHDADSLLEKADQLAMESKRQGKNAITLGPGAESVCHTKR
ncbi:MAG: diguanylate cyclase, partial [Phycisphaerales bacterium]